MTNGDNADLYLRSWDGEASKLSDVKEETVGSNENSYKKKKHARKGSIHFGEMMMTGGRVECKKNNGTQCVPFRNTNINSNKINSVYNLRFLYYTHTQSFSSLENHSR